MTNEEKAAALGFIAELRALVKTPDAEVRAARLSDLVKLIHQSPVLREFIGQQERRMMIEDARCS